MAGVEARPPGSPAVVPRLAGTVVGQMMPPPEDDEPLSFDDIITLLRSSDTDDRLDALAELSIMVEEAYDEEAVLLGQTLRAAGAIPLLAWLAVDEDSLEVQQRALLVLGNLCSDAADPQSYLTKAELLHAGGCMPMSLSIQSDDASVLIYACGCLQNLCHSDEWSRALAAQDGVQQRLAELAGHADERVVRYAAGALKNMLSHLESAGGDDGLSAVAKAAIAKRGEDALVSALRQKRAMAILTRWVQQMPPEKRLQRVLAHKFSPNKRAQVAQKTQGWYCGRGRSAEVQSW